MKQKKRVVISTFFVKETEINKTNILTMIPNSGNNIFEIKKFKNKTFLSICDTKLLFE